MDKALNIAYKYVDGDSEFADFKKEIIEDYVTAVLSREVSYMARKEVLNGKAKFGITGDGKELAQIALAKAFEPGDWLAGYYREQTFMFSKKMMEVEDYFSQLYADCNNDPFSGGRQMNNHFATDTISETDDWLNLVELNNCSSVISCTAGQVARGIGHAYASKVFRSLKLEGFDHLTNNGNEVSFCTIGESSTSEGPFWEMMNAAGVLQIPLVAAVWDDGYGISVPVELQTTKSSISRALEGLLKEKDTNGILIYTAKAWDYQELCAVFKKASIKAREEHVPVLVHVQEATQPQGHSTSGSHERYKSKERLAWEAEYDCNLKMEEWMLSNAIVSEDEIAQIKAEAKTFVKAGIDNAWERYTRPIKLNRIEVQKLLIEIQQKISDPIVGKLIKDVEKMLNPNYSELYQIARKLKFIANKNNCSSDNLDKYLTESKDLAHERYHTNLFASGSKAAVNIPVVKPTYSDKSIVLNGYQIITKYFEIALAKIPELIAFGEDLGKIGDVNQGFAGLQEKFGEERISDTGIREWTIIGQALGASMRGIRPIVEIQYLDYIAYAYSPLSDDVATLRYRTDGKQRAPMIVRTRGHRLEGIWHTGSPMGMILNGMKGIHLCVPRNMVQAVGFYNTLLQSEDPAIVIESLNGYRLKEKLPDNIGEFTIPLGVPELLSDGDDVTIVTYGSCVRVAQTAIIMLARFDITVDLLDVQTLMPFDIEHRIVDSLKKTNRVLFLDEDVPSGGTSFMLREVLEIQNGYQYLDSKPICLTAYDHRTPYGSDGDYFSKPNAEDVFEAVYKMIKEAYPNRLY